MRVEKTADGAAMMRALEQHAPRRLFDDPWSARLISGWPSAVVAVRPLRWLFLRAGAGRGSTPRSSAGPGSSTTPAETPSPAGSAGW